MQKGEKKTDARMRKYRVVIAYDGTAYSGWQYQENAVGIQQVVEDALAYLDGAPVRVYGSSRTDAGVHAKGFVAHFHLTKPIPAKNLVRAMNARLPDAIRVLKASYAKEDFDARLSANATSSTRRTSFRRTSRHIGLSATVRSTSPR